MRPILRPASRRLRPWWLPAFALAALAGCADEPAPAPYAPASAVVEPPGPLIPPAAEPRAKIALLAPMTGARAELGESLRRGALMALDPAQFPGVPELDVRDTRGTPEGARAAADAAVRAGDIAILGPLTGPEVAMAGPVAQAAGVPVLAFTNDAAQARTGVWVLGITAQQQADRLLAALHAQNHDRLAALLPGDDFGRAMADALGLAAGTSGVAVVGLQTHGADAASTTAALGSLTNGAAPLPPPGTPPPAPAVPGVPAADTQPLLPFDTLFLGDAGPALAVVAKALPGAGVDRAAVRIAGPALWAAPNSGASAFPGALYAAPDPAARAAFATQYQTLAQRAPHPVADLAYDAATLLRATPPGALAGASLAGVDGALRLEPDGTVSRSLAVFEVARGAGKLVSPAPGAPAAPPPPS